MRRLCIFYKIKTLKIPEYLYYLIPDDHRTYNTQNLDFVETYICKTNAFKYSFFPIPFLNETYLTQTCAMLNHTQLSENRYWCQSTKPKPYLQSPWSFRSKTSNKI